MLGLGDGLSGIGFNGFSRSGSDFRGRVLVCHSGGGGGGGVPGFESGGRDDGPAGCGLGTSLGGGTGEAFDF